MAAETELGGALDRHGAHEFIAFGIHVNCQDIVAILALDRGMSTPLMVLPDCTVAHGTAIFCREDHGTIHLFGDIIAPIGPELPEGARDQHPTYDEEQQETPGQEEGHSDIVLHMTVHDSRRYDRGSVVRT